MDGVIRIKHIQTYEKVNYYSICVNDEDTPIDEAQSLFEIFIETQGKKNKDKLNHILSWLQEIGNKYGATKRNFRPEQNRGEAYGLPPKNFTNEPVYTEDGNPSPNNLRLYCHRLNDSVVILFNGDIKTENYPQNCPNVKEHFLFANKLTVIIDQAFRDGDLQWIDEDRDIKYSDELILYF